MDTRPTNGLKRNDCMKIAKLTADAARWNDYTKLRAHLDSLGEVSVGWRNDIDKFTAFIDSGEPSYTVFTKGNSKLPFYSFSTLPVYTCPGLGVCAQWCYSFRSWQYPPAFFRQCQNTILAISRADTLTAAFNELPSTTVRLYVDGDYDSEDTLRYWMQRLKDRSDIQAYGYSKSLHLFRALHDSGFQWPDNYKLNLSSGGKYMADLVQDLPVVRGVFVAVPIDRKALKIGRKTAYGTKKYNEAVREAGKKAGYEKSFVCPGKCGSCTKKGHACGLDSFQDIPILIGIH